MLIEKIRHAAEGERTLNERLIGSTATVCIATILQLLIWSVVQPAPYLFFYPAVIVASIYFEGYTSVLLSCLAIQYFFLEPLYSFEMVWPYDHVRMLVFFLSGCSVTLVSKALRRSQARIHQANLELVKVNEELNERNIELSQFASVAAHDLKSPLSSITQASELMLFELESQMTADQKGYFKFIISAGVRMASLVDGLLEFAKAGKRVTEFKDVDLERIVAETTQNLKAQIEKAGAQLNFKRLPKVKGDEVQLMVLFQNLISNAIKYRAPNRAPEIVMNSDEDSNSWIISVRDNGIGFDPKDKDKVFHPFMRSHSEKTHEGAGIGLATAKRIVESHCGEIWVDTTPGIGTVFYVKLPKIPKVAGECVEL